MHSLTLKSVFGINYTVQVKNSTQSKKTRGGDQNEQANTHRSREKCLQLQLQKKKNDELQYDLCWRETKNTALCVCVCVCGTGRTPPPEPNPAH
jgi:hypothetical protein